MRLLVAVLASIALCAAPTAFASEDHPSSLEIQQELWCDDCQTTLDKASSVSYTPVVIGLIKDGIAAGKSKTEIKAEAVTKFRYHVSLASAQTVEKRVTLADLEDEVMCPICNTTLDQSSSGAARQIKVFISQRIAAGDSKNEIKDKLVAEYGLQILAAPPKKGFNLLAWLLPIVGVLGGGLVLAVLAWRWSRGREPGSPARLDPALERRVDEELARFDEG